MKVLIWVLCFFANALITTIIKGNGVILGAIPTVILYGVTIWLARTLCKKWDERKADKTIDQKEMVDTPPAVNKCEMCGHICDKTTAAKIEDDMGVRYRNLCDACMEIYNATPNGHTDIVEPMETKIDGPESAATQIQFCRKCGEKLIENSRFCRKCGTEIIKE
jgi:hypothetical protein